MKYGPIWILLVLATVSAAVAAPPPPGDLHRRAGFDQRLGARVPTDLAFRDAAGRRVDLAQVAAGRPLLLAMGYFHCPNLCDAVLTGMGQGVAGMKLKPGEDFEVAFVSIDPHETPADAARRRDELAAQVSAAHARRWHWLTGSPHAIRTLATAIGYRYFYDPSIGQYAHAAGVVVLDPRGTVDQYLFGVRYRPHALRLALVGASAGHVGNLVDQLVLLCCGYDPTTGRYSLVIGRVMRVAGIGTVLLLALLIGVLAWRRRRAGEGGA